MYLVGFFDRASNAGEERLPTSAPFTASPEIFDLIGTEPDDALCAQLWGQMLLDNSNDFVHVLSLKGVFLYCSASVKTLLQYDPEELLGQNLFQTCHPNDVTPVMREIKESANMSDAISFVYRARAKDGSYLWMESHGRLHREQSKERKCVVLSARPRPIYELSRKAVQITGGTDQNEFWAKMSLDGTYLFVTSTCQHVLGVPPDELISTSLYQLVRSDRATALTRALLQVRDGATVRFRHHIRNRRGQYVEMVSTFFPGERPLSGKPSYVICRSREWSHANTDTLPETASVYLEDPPLETSESGGSETDNMFEVLSTSRSTTWQYEMHQLRVVNRKMREILESLKTKAKVKDALLPTGV